MSKLNNLWDKSKKRSFSKGQVKSQHLLSCLSEWTVVCVLLYRKYCVEQKLSPWFWHLNHIYKYTYFWGVHFESFMVLCCTLIMRTKAVPTGMKVNKFSWSFEVFLQWPVSRGEFKNILFKKSSFHNRCHVQYQRDTRGFMLSWGCLFKEIHFQPFFWNWRELGQNGPHQVHH